MGIIWRQFFTIIQWKIIILNHKHCQQHLPATPYSLIWQSKIVCHFLTYSNIFPHLKWPVKNIFKCWTNANILARKIQLGNFPVLSDTPSSTNQAMRLYLLDEWNIVTLLPGKQRVIWITNHVNHESNINVFQPYTKSKLSAMLDDFIMSKIL